MSTPLSLDRFQRDAIDAIERDESVLVTAPTGAGKTLVADAAIDRALARGARAIYTTPLKALSNQKHRDLRRRLGPRVGLLTGDRAIDPNADVAVMTTEIVRALLDAGSALLDGVSVVVLDEFHYLRDPDRGSVWEEIVMDAPLSWQLVCLSATMPDPQRVHTWIDGIHPPTRLVVETTRPVPLNHLYAIGNIQDHPPLLLPMFDGDRINEVAVRHDGTRNVTRGEGRRQRDVRRPVTPRRATLLDSLREQSLLPAIWFMLSRLGCEHALDELLEDGVSFNDSEQAGRAGAIAELALAGLPSADTGAFDAHRWRAALEHGIATHHGGLLPVQREAVEQAFSEGLLSVVFATETLAVGVNLPARTAVVDRVVRPESQGGDLLGGDEFTQLAGRAGRRGLDEVGFCVVPWAADVAFYRVAGLAGGTPARLESQLRCTPTMVASLAGRVTSVVEGRERLNRSLFAHLAADRAGALQEERTARAAELAALGPAKEPDGLRPEMPTVEAGAHKGTGDIPSLPTSAADSTTPGDGIGPGDVIVDPSRPAPLLVLERRDRRGETLFEVLGTDARRTTLGLRSFRLPPQVIGQLDVDGWNSRVRGQAREAARRLLAMERAGVIRVPGAAPPPPPAARRARDDQRRRARLQAQVDELDARTHAVRAELDHNLEATVALLQRRGHLDGFTLTPSGLLLRRLYHPQGLLVAEALAAGLFDRLPAEELAGVAAGFRAGAGARSLFRTATNHRRVSERLRSIAELTVDLNRDEARLGMEPTLPPDALYADAMIEWAAGVGLGAALAGLDAMPGDFLRDVRQTIELLDQVRACATDPVLAERAEEAMTLLDRDAARIGMLEDVVT